MVEGVELISTQNKYFGVDIRKVASPIQRDSLTKDLSQPLIQVLASIGRINNNPDLLLNMPRLDDKSGADKIKTWLELVGITDITAQLSHDEIKTNLLLSSEVTVDLEKKGNVSIKAVLESIRYEFAKCIFAQRKVYEGNEFIKKFISKELALDGPSKVAVLYNHCIDYMDQTIELFTAGYNGKVGETHLFEINLQEGTKDEYFDPFNIIDEATEHCFAWMMAHEIVHAWSPKVREMYNPRIKVIISPQDLEVLPIEEIAEKVFSETMNESPHLTDLASALDEGFAVFVETKVADGDIKSITDPSFRKNLKKMRENIYQRHRTSGTVSKYYEGFYQVVRLLRRVVKTVPEMIELFSLIDYKKCNKIVIEDDEGMHDTDGYEYIKNPFMIPLRETEKNRSKTIGDYLGKIS